jgi:roadblock/LC7 domain-containing protein
MLISWLPSSSHIRGWTDPVGWIVRGAEMSVCGVANLVFAVENADGNLTQVMEILTEASNY